MWPSSDSATAAHSLLGWLPIWWVLVLSSILVLGSALTWLYLVERKRWRLGERRLRHSLRRSKRASRRGSE